MSCPCRFIIAPLLVVGRKLFGRLPLCGQVGAMLGGQVGAFFGLLMTAESPAGLSQQQILGTALVLAAVAALFAIFVVILLERRSTAALPGILLNALLTSVATVEVNAVVRLPVIAALIGLVVGAATGTILCRAACCRPAVTRERGAGLHA